MTRHAPALPPLLVLTDRTQLPRRRRLRDVVAEAVDAGLRAVVVRERDLEDRERCELVYDVQHLLAPVDGVLVVAGPQIGRPDGVHLRSTEPRPRARPPLLGRSCHGAAELDRASWEGCDLATLSPVAASASKPGHGPALGRAGLADLTRHAALRAHTPGDASVPLTARAGAPRPAVYALGGVNPDNAAGWLAAGAHGVAVMGAVMRARDPGAVVAALLAACTAPT